MHWRIWVLTIGYVLLMLFVGLKPHFGVVFVHLALIISFLFASFLIFVFLTTENKGSKVRTILRYIIIITVSWLIFLFVRYEINTHYIADKIEHVIEEIIE